MPFCTTFESRFLRQCLLTLGGAIASMGTGFSGGITSILVSQLKTSNYIVLDDIKISWFASVIGITSECGMIIAVIVVKYRGRKFGVILSVVSLIIGWFCTYLANSYAILLFGRIILGISIGINLVVTTIYLAECVSPKYRGCLVATTSLSITSGVFLGHLIGNTLGWQKTALFCCLLECFNFCVLLFFPDSPSSLALRGKFDECKKAFHWLRGYDEEDELEKLIKARILAPQVNVKEPSNGLRNAVAKKIYVIKNIATHGHFWKPLTIMFFLTIICECTGGPLIDNYTIDVYKFIVGDGNEMSAILYSVDAQRILCNFLVIFLYKVVNRRSMLLLTLSCNIFFFYLISVYVFAKANGLLPWDHPWIGGALIHMHMLTVATGAGTLPIIINSEIYPLEYRNSFGLCSGMIFSTCYFTNMMMMPYLFSTIGLHGAYVIFGTVVLICTVVVLILLPETKDKTLIDIEDEFKNKGTQSGFGTELELLSLNKMS